MSVTRMTDFVYAFRLLNLIQKPWIEQEAYRLGIIDAEGNNVRKWNDLKTSEEKDNFTYFHRLAFNMKRVLSKVPGFDSKIVQTALAMRLLKEADENDFRKFTDDEIQFVGQKLLEDGEPTNATGAAVSTNIEKPLTTKIIKRKDAESKIPSKTVV